MLDGVVPYPPEFAARYRASAATGKTARWPTTLTRRSRATRTAVPLWQATSG